MYYKEDYMATDSKSGPAPLEPKISQKRLEPLALHLAKRNKLAGLPSIANHSGSRRMQKIRVVDLAAGQTSFEVFGEVDVTFLFEDCSSLGEGLRKWRKGRSRCRSAGG